VRVAGAQNVQDHEQSILTRRAKLDFVNPGRGSSVRLLSGSSHDHTGYCKSFLCREQFPETSERPHEIYYSRENGENNDFGAISRLHGGAESSGERHIPDSAGSVGEGNFRPREMESEVVVV